MAGCDAAWLGARTAPEGVERPDIDVVVSLLGVHAAVAREDHIGRRLAQAEHLRVVAHRHVNVVAARQEQQRVAVGGELAVVLAATVLVVDCVDRGRDVGGRRVGAKHGHARRPDRRVGLVVAVPCRGSLRCCGAQRQRQRGAAAAQRRVAQHRRLWVALLVLVVRMWFTQYSARGPSRARSSGALKRCAPLRRVRLWPVSPDVRTFFCTVHKIGEDQSSAVVY